MRRGTGSRHVDRTGLTRVRVSRTKRENPRNRTIAIVERQKHVDQERAACYLPILVLCDFQAFRSTRCSQQSAFSAFRIARQTSPVGKVPERLWGPNSGLAPGGKARLPAWAPLRTSSILHPVCGLPGRGLLPESQVIRIKPLGQPIPTVRLNSTIRESESTICPHLAKVDMCQGADVGFLASNVCATYAFGRGSLPGRSRHGVESGGRRSESREGGPVQVGAGRPSRF
jgi:hypothetical protein